MEPSPASPPQRGQHPLANYQFSSDELRVLRECNTDSFFQRCLPLGIGFGVTAYFCVKNGYLKPNGRFGAMPKVFTGVIVGYFIGKFSYQKKCAEKLMRLPNSRLAEVLRQRKQTGQYNITSDASMGLALASPFVPSGGGLVDIYSDEHQRDVNPSTSLNLDVESRPTIAGLDDIYRPSVDSSSTFSEPELTLEPAKPGTNYEDLRKRNREEYMKKQQNPYSRPLPAEAPIITRAHEAAKSFGGEQERVETKGSKNKYGDTWTD